MVIHLNSIIGVVIGILTLAALIAGGAGYYSGQSAKSRIAQRDQDIAAWEVRYHGMEVDLATEKSDRAHDVEKLMNENGLVREQLNTSNQRIQNLADVIRAQDTLKEIVDVISSNNELGRAILTITQEIARKAGVPID
jgi:uncharacterized protein HemX